MSYLGQIELKQELRHRISPFDKNRIDAAKYELSLGSNFYTSDSEEYKILNADKDNQIVVNPGQFCLLETLETIEIPQEYIGFINIKASRKLMGLLNISGFHVDPGFKGKLIYSVFNAGSNTINLEVGKPLFQLWLAQLTSKSKYDGEHQGQTGLTSKQLERYMNPGKIASPSQLKMEINRLDGLIETKSSGLKTDLETKIEKVKSLKDRLIWIFGLISTILLGICIRLAWEWPTIEKAKKELKTEIFQELKMSDLENKYLENAVDSVIKAKFTKIDTQKIDDQ